MPRYAIAFYTRNREFLHKVVEMDSREAALRFFFQNFVKEEYSKDEEGYSYFSEDFNDPEAPQGNILQI